MRFLGRALTPMLALVVVALSALVWRLSDGAGKPAPSASLPGVTEDGYRVGTLADDPDDVTPRDDRAAVQAAVDAVVPVLTFEPEALDENLAEATSWMTESFAAKYSKAFGSTVRPMATDKDASATAVVLGAGILGAATDGGEAEGEDDAGTVRVLVFADQTVTSTAGVVGGEARPAPTEGQLRLVLTMTRVAGDWKVDGLVAL
ncbi:hypothetical protein [Nocardioides sp. R-C-SC26]|uniref:hypothetical protein n=1 Tax=Nocardioides sp. R-C-SC26 TaxID=2870414 RepID=UPI001E2DFB55|nr:hypothetical protein [Nocardioides sp. R-C-SC26]